MKNKLIVISFIITIGMTFMITSLWIDYTKKYNGFNNIPSYFFNTVSIIEVILYLSTFILLFRLSIRLSNVNIGIIFKEIGKYSFGIYLIHVMFLTIYERLLSIYNITYDKGYTYPMLFFLTLITSYTVIRIISYFPYSRLIIGIHNNLEIRSLHSKNNIETVGMK